MTRRSEDALLDVGAALIRLVSATAVAAGEAVEAVSLSLRISNVGSGIITRGSRPSVLGGADLGLVLESGCDVGLGGS